MVTKVHDSSNNFHMINTSHMATCLHSNKLVVIAAFFFFYQLLELEQTMLAEGH